MLHSLFTFVAIGLAIFLGKFAADGFVALTQGRLRFGLRSMLLFTAVVSLALMGAVAIIKK